MGAVLAAVSPAVVVPRMVKLMETGYGTKKEYSSDDAWPGHPVMIFLSLSCFLHFPAWPRAAAQGLWIL